jgi:hypothetical protein
MERYESWIERARSSEESIKIAKECLGWTENKIKESGTSSKTEV